MEDRRPVRTILIVEDHQGFATLLQRCLTREGFQPQVASTGHEALRWLAQQSADLLLLDLHLPDMTGEEVVQHLKDRHIPLPFIVITGAGDERRAVQLMKQGAQDYFIKDQSVVEFLPSIIEQTFQQIARTDQLALARESLTLERERMAITLASLAEGVFTTDTQGLLTYMNRKGEQLTGWDSDQAIGRPVEEVVQFDSQHTPLLLGHPTAHVLTHGVTLNPSTPHFLLPHQGSEHPVLYSASLLRQTDGAPIGSLLIIRDLTDRVKLDQEGLKISKLEALGTLAGGIAHDFNNYLTAILGNISLTKTCLNSRDRLYGYLSEAENASLGAKRLTHQLLTFAKGGDPMKKPVQLPGLIQMAIGQTLTNRSIRYQEAIPEDLWIINGDENQLTQVVHNLIQNAQQSMAIGGCLTLQAENVILDEDEARCYRLSHPGQYVKLMIQDTGTGIPANFLPNIFDPYFSSKPQGNGLGLATAFSIVQKHRGTITVSSLPGQGSTFSLYLPAQAGRVSPPTTPSTLPKCEGRILVMDDEESIRLVLGEMLKHLGYEVHCTAEGQEALERYREAFYSQNPFSAVILDLTVQNGLGGKETIQQLRDFDPKVKAIVASGYSQDLILSQYEDYGFQGVVAKPFRLTELSQALNQVNLRPSPEPLPQSH